MSTLLQIALKSIQVKHTAMFSPISMGFHSKSHVTIPFYWEYFYLVSYIMFLDVYISIFELIQVKRDILNKIL